jgi:hypothetical protein
LSIIFTINFILTINQWKQLLSLTDFYLLKSIKVNRNLIPSISEICVNILEESWQNCEEFSKHFQTVHSNFCLMFFLSLWQLLHACIIFIISFHFRLWCSKCYNTINCGLWSLLDVIVIIIGLTALCGPWSSSEASDSWSIQLLLLQISWQESFPGWGCQPHAQPPAILEGRCFLSGLSLLAD